MLILSGHYARVHTLAFSLDGLALASLAGKGFAIWMWDLASGQLRERFQHNRRVVSLAFSPGERRVLACADSIGQVSLWELVSGKETPFAHVVPWPNHSVQLAFTPEGESLIATALNRPEPILWSDPYRPGITRWAWPLGPSVEWEYDSSHGGLTCCAFSPDGRSLVAGSLDGHVAIWDEINLGLWCEAMLHGQVVHLVAYSPDGRMIVSADQRGLVKLWDAHTGRCRGTLKGQTKPLHGIAFSPDGMTLATGSGDGQVRFWDVESKRLRRAFDWGIGKIHSIAFAPDGLRAAAGGDKDIMIWDIDEW